ncbi:putative Zinc finger of C2H2 type Pre mRNA splicing factor SF3a complex subunit 2 (Prp11) [Trypanosoma vivax]|uniref:U1-type domain-containing protein n=1 Tax=Trypanosoma vivax (strain Y486) TaxID=1055687 RepID=G0TRP6_TRYVY|nr:hypothetical protein TRVL_06291 [Trypanosoma vivax]KAH8607978.1 putative Zinc finger of C2H2 type Pre mRNA splicing factor SF3a complex subunit 2 (Prp11) [Trypanosoma vivax]CCC46617.1 conserved hypothetical protein [Trypanosoma vivax Y486]
MSNSKAFDPSAVASRDPYYRRNHMGRVVCTLCDICCSDDNNFLKHLAGKTHSVQLERMQRNANREKRLAEEEELNKAAMRRAEQERAARELILQQQQQASTSSMAGGHGVAAFAPFGKPSFHYCTEHDPEQFQTKVWIEVYFPQAVEGARPLHRWRSAREQEVERPPDDNVVYLLVACEGYMTIALKFPAKIPRTSASTAMGLWDHGAGGSRKTDEEEGKYRSSWDPIKKVYELFFIMG